MTRSLPAKRALKAPLAPRNRGELDTRDVVDHEPLRSDAAPGLGIADEHRQPRSGVHFPPVSGGQGGLRDALRGAAFSLVEVMVALVMGIIVLGVAVDVAATAMRRGAHSRAVADLARDGVFAARLLEQDLRLAGSGVPQGKHVEQVCTGGGGCSGLYGAGDTTFTSFLLQADDNAVGLVGDVPRLDGNFPALGFLTRRPTGLRTSLMWQTENNGACAPTTPSTCSTALTSLFFPGESGCQSNANDRTCPWGLRRLLAGEAFQIVAGDQNWSHTVVETPLTLEAPATLHFTQGLAVANFDASEPQPVWPNVMPETPPMGVRGAGWVTTLDRVFFFVDGDRLKRVQCSGDVDPGAPEWSTPVTFTPAQRAASRPKTPNACGPPETVARHVESLTFRYFEPRPGAPPRQLSTPVAPPDLPRINRVDFELQLKETSNGEEVRHVVQGTIHVAARVLP